MHRACVRYGYAEHGRGDVGDWHADPKEFPHGIASLADSAHSRGLKFGLWMDWTQAGTSEEAGALNVNNPATRDGLIADPPAGWKHPVLQGGEG
jgi:hypothetical protein